MIGDKRMEMPKTKEEALKTYKCFGLSNIGLVADTVQMDNARQLVHLNNEVYEKLNPTCEKCGCILNQQNICMDCAEQENLLRASARLCSA